MAKINHENLLDKLEESAGKGIERQLLTKIETLPLSQLLEKPQDEMHLMMLELFKVVDFEKALVSPKIFQLQKTLSSKTLVKLTGFIIKSFASTVNVKNNITSYQIMDVTHLFLQQYTHSSLKDLILCLKMAKYGKLGPIYDRLDVPTVMDFIRKYQEAKSAYLEQKARGFKDAEANEVNQLCYALPEPVKNKVVNSLPAQTINREYKRLKLSIDKKRMKMKQEVYRGYQKMNNAPKNDK